MIRNSIIILILFFSKYSFSQRTISGKIVDVENFPISNVLIINDTDKKSTYSDSVGFFKIEVSDSCSYISISHASFQKEVLVLNSDTFYQIRLLDFSFTKEVLVEEEKIDNIEKVDIPPVLNPSVSGGDIADLVGLQLGVNKADELSSGYNVRGGNFDENLVYVNGIEVYRPLLVRSGQQEGLSFANPNLVENIQFSAGGFDAIYGDKMSSVLDVTYKKPEELEGSATLSLLGTQFHLGGSSKDKKWSHISGFRWRTNQYVLNSLNTQGDYQPNFIDLQSMVYYDLTEKLTLNFFVNYSLNRFNFIPETRETNFGTFNQSMRINVYFEGQEKDRFESLTGALAANYKLKENINLNFNASFFKTYEDVNYDILGEYFLSDVETDLSSEDIGESINQRGVGSYLDHSRNYLDGYIGSFNFKGDAFKVKEKTLLDLTHTNQWGVNYKYEFITGEQKTWQMLDSAGYNVPRVYDSIGYVGNQPYQLLQLKEVQQGDYRVQNNRLQAYYQKSWKWQMYDIEKVHKKDFWMLNAGVRAQYWSIANKLIFSPRVSLYYKPESYKKSIKVNGVKQDTLIRQNIKYKIAGGIYQQPPFYREYIAPDGSFNANVLEQFSYHIVAGMEYDFSVKNSPFKFMSELYYKGMNNVNPYRIDNVQIQYNATNDAIAYAAGIDMKLHAQFINGVESWVSMSFLTTKEDLANDFYYNYYNADGDRIGDPNVIDNNIVDSSVVYPGFIPRPTDRSFKFQLFYQDEMPNLEQLKVHLNLIVITPFPFGPDGGERYQDVFRSTAYRRADVGFSYDLLPKDQEKRKTGFWKPFKAFNVALEVFNFIGIDNVSSYYWITDVSGVQYAIPNYLTGRRVNVKLNLNF